MRRFASCHSTIPPRSWPRYFMLRHATELALEVYLFYHGATPTELMSPDGQAQPR